ncbi:MAG TPA: ferrochelatase [Candidatus Limnocylindria bacterium]|nr:ferrochelatase [Candidatus Limnocylindria bacterium]
MTTGVVLMTYGAPHDDADLPRYLAAVRGGREPAPDLVAEMRRRYALIGGSPLVRITRAQAAALEAELGEGHVAAAGMRFSEPRVAGAVRELVERGADRVVGICMSPQWSPRLMGGYEEALREAAAGAGVPSVIAPAWYREPAFIGAVAERLRESLAGADARAAIVLTAHSLPRRVFETEPEYIAQLHETAELVAAAAGLERERWHWAYQSAGHTQEEWLRPDLKELFPTLAALGASEVLVVPVQFLADHLEVLYDLDVAAAEEARACGLRYRRVAMANTQAAFIRALAAVARDAGGIRSGAAR